MAAQVVGCCTRCYTYIIWNCPARDASMASPEQTLFVTSWVHERDNHMFSGNRGIYTFGFMPFILHIFVWILGPSVMVCQYHHLV